MFSCDGEKKYFRQTRGISTGLACGSQLANMFLSCLDETIIASFGADIALYKRYIDDILIVAHNVALHSFLEIMSSFDPDIRITHDSSETDGEDDGPVSHGTVPIEEGGTAAAGASASKISDTRVTHKDT